MRRTCPICGKIFESNTCGKYCSDECRKKKVYEKRVYKKSCAFVGNVRTTQAVVRGAEVLSPLKVGKQYQ